MRVAAIAPPPPPPQPRQPSPAETIALDCRFDRLTVGSPVTCDVTGGPAGSELSWQVTSNPIIAEGQVVLDADGAGQFSFTVTPKAADNPLFVAVIGWIEPVGVGTIAANVDDVDEAPVAPDTPPIPVSIPAGDGGARHGSVPLAFVALSVVAALAARSQLMPDTM